MSCSKLLMISAVSLSLTLRSLLSSRNTSSACIMYVQYTQVCKKVLLLCNKVCHRFDLSQSFNKASAVTLQDLGCLPHSINTHSAGSFCMYRDVLKSDSCLSESFIRLPCPSGQGTSTVSSFAALGQTKPHTSFPPVQPPSPVKLTNV